MAAASFNPIQSQQPQLQSNQPLTLKQGQVFHGTIKQIFPNQTAEVQVGQNKIYAKLDAPLKVGDAHFFQVMNVANQAEIKVVTGALSQNMTQTEQLNKLLETMNLPKTAEIKQTMAHFMKAQVPITKEQLVQADTWLKTLPAGVSKEQALQALQKMVENKLPFSTEVFKALVLGGKTDGISGSLQNLLQQLNIPGGNEVLKDKLAQQIQSIAKPLQAEVGGTILAKAVQTMLNAEAPIANKLQVLNMLKETATIPTTATLQTWQSSMAVDKQSSQPLQQLPAQASAGQVLQFLQQAKPEQLANKLQQITDWVAKDTFLTAIQKDQIQMLFNRATQLPQSEQTVQALSKQLQQQLLTSYAANQGQQTFTENAAGQSVKSQILSLLKPELTLQNSEPFLRQLANTASQSSQAQIQVMSNEGQLQVEANVNGKAMEQALKSVLKGLGLSYEAVLASKAGDMQQVAQQLKPQLQALLQDQQTPTLLRDAADHVLSRMNGAQLLSTDNGVQQQIVMQVPLEFFGKKMDATLHWNGRMKEDGKIDPNYVRVMFYLNMEHLQETVIDMQVQNRVVTLQIYNENQVLEGLVEPLKEVLKLGLEEKGYQLSGVFMKTFEQQNIEKKQLKQTKVAPGQSIRLDYRV